MSKWLMTVGMLRALLNPKEANEFVAVSDLTWAGRGQAWQGRARQGGARQGVAR